MKKTFKKQINKIKKKGTNGITLIALVITIIVLLILAGISIAMLAGDNSILNQATNAKVETRGGTVQEQVALWKNEQIAKEMTGTGTAETIEQIVNRLVSENLLTEDEKDQILGNDTKGIEATGQVTIGSRTIVFGLPDEKDNLEIGDVVEATGLAKFKDSSNNDIEWIYFGKDDSGKKFVTTAKPLTNTFELNKQPSGVSRDDKKVNSAKNWLYYDLQEGDEGYNDKDSNNQDICTTENNINKFCENLYTTNGGTAGKARSITLEDINRVTGFKAPTFNKYNFGTTNDYSDTNVTGNHTVKYYYPTFDAKDQTTATGSTPKVYKYWKKASNSSDIKEFPCDAYYYYKDQSDDSYKLNWEGTSRTWTNEPLSETSTWKLKTPKNMKYVVGESNDYLYAVGSRSVYVYSNSANFLVAGVSYGYVNSGRNNFCYSDSSNAYVNGSYSIPVRPIVSLGSEVKLNKVQ